jgi:hypothetical protein
LALPLFTSEQISRLKLECASADESVRIGFACDCVAAAAATVNMFGTVQGGLATDTFPVSEERNGPQPPYPYSRYGVLDALPTLFGPDPLLTLFGLPLLFDICIIIDGELLATLFEPEVPLDPPLLGNEV